MITRASLSSIAQGMPKYRSMLAGNDYYVPPAFESIATSTPTSGTSITLNSIPQTYKHLQLRINFVQGSNSGNLYAYFNNDSTYTSYTTHILRGNASTATATGYAAGGYGALALLESSGTTTYPAGIIMDILDYNSTSKFKTVKVFSAIEDNGGGNARIFLMSSMWLSTAAVTRIDVQTSTSFASGANIALYGIKG